MKKTPNSNRKSLISQKPIKTVKTTNLQKTIKIPKQKNDEPISPRNITIPTEYFSNDKNKNDGPISPRNITIPTEYYSNEKKDKMGKKRTSKNSIFSKKTSSTTSLFTMKNSEYCFSDKNILKNNNQKINDSINSNNNKFEIINTNIKKEPEILINNKPRMSRKDLISPDYSFFSNKNGLNKNPSNKDKISKKKNIFRSRSFGLDSSDSLDDLFSNNESFDLTPLPQLNKIQNNENTIKDAKFLRRLEYDFTINKGFRHVLDAKGTKKNQNLIKYYSYIKKFVQIFRKLSKNTGGIGEKIIFLRFIYKIMYQCYKLHFHYFISKIKGMKKKKIVKKISKKNSGLRKTTNNINIICFENKINIINNKNRNCFSIEKNNNFDLFIKPKKKLEISNNSHINIIKPKKLFDIEKGLEFQLLNDKLPSDYFDNFIKHLSNIFGENINISGMKNFPRPFCEGGKNKKILRKTYLNRLYKLEEHKIHLNKVNTNNNNAGKNKILEEKIDLFLLKKSKSLRQIEDNISDKNNEQIEKIDEIIYNQNQNQNEKKHIKLIKKKARNLSNFITKITIKNDNSKNNIKKNNSNINNNNEINNKKNNLKKFNTNRLMIDLIIIFINNFWLIKIKKYFFENFLNDYYYPTKRNKNDLIRFSSKCELMEEDEENFNKIKFYLSSKKYENNLFKK
jgi:hypothetical protein